MAMPFRLLAVFVVAAFVAGQINRGIYRLAWDPREIGPWSKPHKDAPQRTWRDRIPIIGWWFLQRESSIHGPAFWVRPLLLELGFAISMAFLYYFEVVERGLLPLGGMLDESILHQQYFSHFILAALMMVATFIDIDEKIIPDEITIPGTLAGFTLAVFLPHSLLPSWIPVFPPGPIAVGDLRIPSPSDWPPILDRWQGLLIGFACLAAWIYAVLPKTLWYRGGVVKFFRYLVVSIFRSKLTKWLIGLFLLTSLLTAAVWSLGGERWHALLTSLVGMVAGGGIVWAVRAIAGPILGQEAMGFGDVTLMGMIGAFVGWQASLFVFFLAPFTGALIAVVHWLITKRKDIAFGPFLCSAACIVIVCWATVWDRYGFPLFFMGWFIPAIVGICLVMLGVMLGMWQGMKRLLFRGDE